MEDELSQRTALLELSMKMQEGQLQEIKGTLQAYIGNEKQCHFCKALGHFKRNCPKLKNKGNYNDKSREGFQKRKGPPYVYCVDFSEPTANNKSDVDNNSDAAIFLHVKINNKNCDTLILSGAGPFVIDVAVLNEWNLFNKIKLSKCGRNLYGLGISKIIGTIVLKVQVHQNLVKNQEFKVVEGLGRTIILGRTFLFGFKTLKINWDTLQVDTGNASVWGSDVIKGGEVGSRVMVAQGDFIAEIEQKNNK